VGGGGGGGGGGEGTVVLARDLERRGWSVERRDKSMLRKDPLYSETQWSCQCNVGCRGEDGGMKGGGPHFDASNQIHMRTRTHKYIHTFLQCSRAGYETPSCAKMKGGFNEDNFHC